MPRPEYTKHSKVAHELERELGDRRRALAVKIYNRLNAEEYEQVAGKIFHAEDLAARLQVALACLEWTETTYD